MQISVIIPTFNRETVLRKTLAALRNQCLSREDQTSQSPPFEVLVVDDGSTDGTRDSVDHVRHDFPVPLRYLHQQNRKQGAARNRGAAEARGSLLVFLGDDTVPGHEFLAQHRGSHHKEEPRRVTIGYTPWAPDLQRTRFMQYIGEEGWQFGFSLIEDPEHVPFNFFYTSNLSIQRAFFLDSGGFDEDFQEYGWEDIELSFRLKKLGMRLTYNEKAIAFHHHPTTLNSFVLRQQRVGFSAWTFYRKHPELAEFLTVDQAHPPPRLVRLKMALLTQICSLTEGIQWLDFSRYYPDLMSYHYRLGLLRARDEH